MAKEMKEMRESLDEILASKSKFGLDLTKDNVRVNKVEETHSYVEASSIIGREKDRENIIQSLLHQSSDNGGKLCVIPIVGIGGLGKTAVAKLVYNDERIDKHFEMKMWACVSDEFELRKVVEKIIKSTTDSLNMFGETSYSNVAMDKLQKMLRKEIVGKRYLLVLDDVWNNDKIKWDELEELLRVGANGSKILVTTRSKEVASIMGSSTDATYTLSSLPHDMCWSLFAKCAFKEGKENQYPNLVKIGHEIVRKCGGIPLAVRTLASHLFSKIDEEEWKRLRDSELWKLEQKGSHILPALMLSYEKLPVHLKRCITLCSIFPKDHQFNNLSLLQFWTAHGLLEHPNREEDCVSYIKALESRCFFQDFESKIFLVTFKLHDLVHDLVSAVAQDECLRIKSIDSSIPKTIRHFSVATLTKNDSKGFESAEKIPLDKVRTIRIEDKINDVSIIESHIARFKYLRALDFGSSQFEMLPVAIGSLKHLRYIYLGENVALKRLPNSLWKLQNLETLILGGCEALEELPKDIKYLINLQFLVFTTKQKCLPEDGIGSLKYLRFLGIISCGNIKYLFDDMQGLKSLRTLIIGDCSSLISLPQSMKHLIALEILVIAQCRNFDWATKEVKDDQNDIYPSNLKKLGIIELPKLQQLPKWLFQWCFNSLQSISIAKCLNLVDLTDELQNLTAIQQFVVIGCPGLKERYQPNTGLDWGKIAHIPTIIFNDPNN